jgi:hypothetical protein
VDKRSTGKDTPYLVVALVEPLLQSSHPLYEIWVILAVSPNLKKVMDGLLHSLDYIFVSWTKGPLAMIHHIWWQPLLKLHFNLQSSHSIYEMWVTLAVSPNLKKVTWTVWSTT